ncbi:MAG TPA: hypothetical protein VER55_07855, partial [Ardenticatenaceae bacterium]|nr:hypothetical protein [Ardenticatenaceae bacterium]
MTTKRGYTLQPAEPRLAPSLALQFPESHRAHAPPFARLWLERERLAVGLVLVVAFIQMLVYIFLLPPWQHYDEPSHFEYAWLIANQGGLRPGEPNPVLRREVMGSMLAHEFYRDLAPPDLLGDGRSASIGISQFGGVPAYYLFISIPLRLVRHLDVTTQLYVARGASGLLFLLTALIAAALTRDLTPSGHPLRWVVPLVMVLIPSFADLMTAVNDDVGATFAFSLVLWAAARLLRFGLDLWRVLWLVVASVAAVLTKNTAGVAVALAPVALLLAVWLRVRARWWWFAALTLLSLAVVVVA